VERILVINIFTDDQDQLAAQYSFLFVDLTTNKMEYFAISWFWWFV